MKIDTTSPENAGVQEKMDQLAKQHAGTVFDLIGAKFVELNQTRVVATFALNQATQQAFGLMHGGIYAYIAESLASLGGWLSCDLKKQICVGIEVNANHLKSVSKIGMLITATAAPVHAGKTVQVWEVKFNDEAGTLVSISRCTLLIREIKS